MKDTSHPKAVAAAAAAQHKAAEAQRRKAAILEVVTQDGVRFYQDEKITVVYKVQRRNVIEVSTALRHPTDKFDKNAGRIMAITRWATGARTQLYRPTHLTPKAFIASTFGVI